MALLMDWSRFLWIGAKHALFWDCMEPLMAWPLHQASPHSLSLDRVEPLMALLLHHASQRESAGGLKEVG
eukprot:1159356-Pelagomonas_calceolata.AAC.1